eukprot:gene1448-32823_t
MPNHRTTTTGFSPVKSNQWIKEINTRDAAIIVTGQGGQLPLNMPANISELLQALDIIVRHCLAAQPGISLRGNSYFYTQDASNDERRRMSFPLPRGCQAALGFRAALQHSKKGLTLSVDTTRTAYISEQPLVRYMCEIMDLTPGRNGVDRVGELQQKLKEPRNLKRLNRALKNITVEFLYDKPKKKTLKMLDKHTSDSYIFHCNEMGDEAMSITQYNESKGRILKYPGLPVACVDLRRNTYIPPELLKVKAQPLKTQPDRDQTDELIKAAAVPPQEKIGEILTTVLEESVRGGSSNILNNPSESLEKFGIRIQRSQNPDPEAPASLMTVSARVLAPPKIAYGNQSVVMTTDDGAWKMYRQKFYRPGELKSWAVIAMCPREVYEHTLVGVMQDAGIKVPLDNKNSPLPPIVHMDRGNRIEDMFNEAYAANIKAYGKQALKGPDIIIVVFERKRTPEWYGPVKKHAVIEGRMVQFLALEACKVGKCTNDPKDRNGRSS